MIWEVEMGGSCALLILVRCSCQREWLCGMQQRWSSEQSGGINGDFKDEGCGGVTHTREQVTQRLGWRGSGQCWKHPKGLFVHSSLPDALRS